MLVSQVTSRRGLSLPTKIFLCFAAIIVAFGVTLGFALVNERKTLGDLTLVSGGLLPATHSVAEDRNTQELLVTTLESAPERRLPWLSAVRQLRPARLRRTARTTRQASELANDPDMAELLLQFARELEDIGEEAQAQEPEYRELFDALENGDNAQAQALFYQLTRRERELSHRLERVQSQIVEQISLIARGMEQAERQLLWALLLLTIGSLVVAAGLILFSWRALAPLSRLTTGVMAVGAGDLKQRVDITSRDEIGALAAEFNRMTERLVEREEQLVRSERLATIGKVVAKVTHEIRNPLNSINLEAEMLMEDLVEMLPAKDGQEARDHLEVIIRSIEVLEKITEDYLRFARLPEPSLEPADISLAVDEFVGLQRDDLSHHGVRVELSLADDLPEVALDELQFQNHVLGNILRNAREAIVEGGTVSIQTRSVEGGVELLIEDDGPGMPPETAEKVFEPFFTTKSSGTGLGLPNVQHIVTQHGGKISCRSEPGIGTCFAIWLPAYKPEDSSGSLPSTRGDARNESI